jgi:hypothetical protein
MCGWTIPEMPEARRYWGYNSASQLSGSALAMRAATFILHHRRRQGRRRGVSRLRNGLRRQSLVLEARARWLGTRAWLAAHQYHREQFTLPASVNQLLHLQHRRHRNCRERLIRDFPLADPLTVNHFNQFQFKRQFHQRIVSGTQSLDVMLYTSDWGRRFIGI